jgi:hypothetical protein
MDPRTLARVIAIGRAVIGAALIVSPSRAASAWVGEDSKREPTQVALAAVGGRDLVLGLGAAWAVGGGEAAKPWLLAAAAADTTDLLATLRHRDALTTTAVAGIGALAGGAAVAGLWTASQLD